MVIQHQHLVLAPILRKIFNSENAEIVGFLFFILSDCNISLRKISQFLVYSLNIRAMVCRSPFNHNLYQADDIFNHNIKISISKIYIYYKNYRRSQFNFITSAVFFQQIIWRTASIFFSGSGQWIKTLSVTKRFLAGHAS